MADELKNDLYPKSYGAWAGRPAGTRPDFTRCCAEVADTSTGWTRFHQCSRKRGHGPDEAYCKTHDPAAVKAKRDEAQRKYDEKWAKERVKSWGPTFYEALKQIADGHNDARQLAKDVLEKFEPKG